MYLSAFQLNAIIVLVMLSVAATRPEFPTGPVTTESASPTSAIAVSVATPDVMSLSVEPFHPEPVMLGHADSYTPPDFTRYKDVSAKKQAFYEYLLPMVHEANEEVARERVWLEMVARAMVQGSIPGADVLNEITRMEARYAIRRPANSIVERVAALMERVDIVPASLVLAQAAKESGWGTSRFAREGNNFFGIWCFYQGCGMTPRQRSAELTHEVAVFDTVEEGVRYYIRTINTHVAYTDLRRMRAQARRQDEVVQGTELANGLVRYSERGLAYVREIQSMIRYNDLQRFTRPYRV